MSADTSLDDGDVINASTESQRNDGNLKLMLENIVVGLNEEENEDGESGEQENDEEDSPVKVSKKKQSNKKKKAAAEEPSRDPDDAAGSAKSINEDLLSAPNSQTESQHEMSSPGKLVVDYSRPSTPFKGDYRVLRLFKKEATALFGSGDFENVTDVSNIDGLYNAQCEAWFKRETRQRDSTVSYKLSSMNFDSKKKKRSLSNKCSVVKQALKRKMIVTSSEAIDEIIRKVSTISNSQESNKDKQEEVTVKESGGDDKKTGKKVGKFVNPKVSSQSAKKSLVDSSQVSTEV